MTLTKFYPLCFLRNSVLYCNACRITTWNCYTRFFTVSSKNFTYLQKRNQSFLQLFFSQRRHLSTRISRSVRLTFSRLKRHGWHERGSYGIQVGSSLLLYNLFARSNFGCRRHILVVAKWCILRRCRGKRSFLAWMTLGRGRIFLQKQLHGKTCFLEWLNSCQANCVRTTVFFA